METVVLSKFQLAFLICKLKQFTRQSIPIDVITFRQSTEGNWSKWHHPTRHRFPLCSFHSQPETRLQDSWGLCPPSRPRDWVRPVPGSVVSWPERFNGAGQWRENARGLVSNLGLGKSRSPESHFHNKMHKLNQNSIIINHFHRRIRWFCDAQKLPHMFKKTPASALGARQARMYGIFTCIRLIFMVNVGNGWYGSCSFQIPHQNL